MNALIVVISVVMGGIFVWLWSNLRKGESVAIQQEHFPVSIEKEVTDSLKPHPLEYEIIKVRHHGARVLVFGDGTAYPLPKYLYANKRDVYKLILQLKMDEYNLSVTSTNRKTFSSVYNELIDKLETRGKLKYKDGTILRTEREFFRAYRGIDELMRVMKRAESDAA